MSVYEKRSICVHVSVCVQVCPYIVEGMQSPELHIRCLPQPLLTWLTGAGSSTEPGVH